MTKGKVSHDVSLTQKTKQKTTKKNRDTNGHGGWKAFGVIL
jgi:hypothetical protein